MVRCRRRADTLKYLNQWNATAPLPHPLRFAATSNELLAKIDVWDLINPWHEWCKSLADALLRVDYFLAVNHLLQGAIFRPEPTPIELGVWSRQQISIISRSYSQWRETHSADAKLDEEEQAASGTAEDRIEFSLSEFQTLIQPLCLKFWWKLHKQHPNHDFVREK